MNAKITAYITPTTAKINPVKSLCSRRISSDTNRAATGATDVAIATNPPMTKIAAGMAGRL
jgi:hypothetical protein